MCLDFEEKGEGKGMGKRCSQVVYRVGKIKMTVVCKKIKRDVVPTECMGVWLSMFTSVYLRGILSMC